MAADRNARRRLLRWLTKGRAVTRDWSPSLGARWTDANREGLAFDADAAERLRMRGARVNGHQMVFEKVPGTRATYMLREATS